MQSVQIGPLSFSLEGDWSPASVVLVAPRREALAGTMMTAQPVTQYRANIVVNLEPAAGNSLQDLAKKHRVQLESQAPDYRVIGEEAVTVDGREGLLREHTLTDAAGFQLQQLQLLLLIDEARLLHALASDHVGSFADRREEFRAGILTVRFR